MIRLTFGATPNPRLEPLIDGTVRPQNIDLEFVLVPPGELFYRNLRYDEFDVFETSLSESLIAMEKRDASRWQWGGLPIFLSKPTIWLGLLVNAASGINHPRDLKGRRVGIPDYPMTAALWMRTILEELYEVQPADITWYLGRTKELSHGGILGFDQDPYRGVSVHWLTEDQTLDVLLDRGELDAAFGVPPRTPAGIGNFRPIDRYGGTAIEGNPRIRKLFSDGGRQITTEYYEKSSILPANHMVAVQNRILAEHPWVALELYKACERAKEVAYERARRLRSTYLLFNGVDDRNQAAIFGEDPYPLGIKENRKMLEVLFQSSFEEGLTKQRARLEDVFYRSTLET